jgi:ATP-dependent Clp protease protease subunit
MNQWFQITNKADDDSPAEIRIYGEIGGSWDGSGVEVEAFANELAQIPKAKDIMMRIHSPGGSVFDGLAIYNMLAERKANLTARVDGLAASAASWIALAANKVQMPKHSRMMIHDAQGLVVGDSETMREMADLLDRESDKIAAIYADKTGKPAKAMRDLMRETTWMDGEEAVKAGFADEVIDVATVANTFNLSRFTKVPAGLGGAEASTETKPKEKTMEVKNQAPVEAQKPAPENIITADQIKALENKLQAERTARITAQLTPLCAERGIDPKPFVDQASSGEQGESLALNMIKAIPLKGGEASQVVENKGNPLIEKYNAMEPGADRNKFRMQNHDTLQNVLTTFNPKNANTIAAGLVNDYMADGLIVVAHNKLAPLNVFTRDFGVDPMKPRASVDVRKATVGSTSQSNATNFESGDSTLAVSTVTVNQLSNSFHLLNSELNQGSRLAHLAQINANNLADKISDAITAVMVTGTYGTAITVGAAANFDSADLPPILAAAKNYGRKVLLLDGGHLAYLLPTDRDSFRLGEQGAYGFDVIAEQNRWTDATANTCGFVCGPDAIVLASGRSIELPSGQFESIGSVTLPQGITVQTATWYNTAGRVWWAAYDVMFGAVAGDTTQAEVLITA